jgi:hypothetical protein
MLRKGSAGVSRRATGPPTIQKKATISASPPRADDDIAASADGATVKTEPLVAEERNIEAEDARETTEATIEQVTASPPQAETHNTDHVEQETTC